MFKNKTSNSHEQPQSQKCNILNIGDKMKYF